MTAWPAVSTVQSLVVTQQPLYLSSLRPPAVGNESVHQLQCAYCSLRSLGVLASVHAFRYSRAPGNGVCAFPIPGNEKNRPGNANPTRVVSKTMSLKNFGGNKMYVGVWKLAANGNASRWYLVSRRVKGAHCFTKTGADTRQSSIIAR